jgi:hypothetical protein
MGAISSTSHAKMPFLELDFSITYRTIMTPIDHKEEDS